MCETGEETTSDFDRKLIRVAALANAPLLSRDYSKGQPRMEANGREFEGETHVFQQRVLLTV